MHDKNANNGILRAASEWFQLWEYLWLGFVLAISNVEQVPYPQQKTGVLTQGLAGPITISSSGPLRK